VSADNVVNQNGGISGGVASPVKFSTGQQFPINDPATQQVRTLYRTACTPLASASPPGDWASNSLAPCRVLPPCRSSLLRAAVTPCC
jgi:hypothetical protein